MQKFASWFSSEARRAISTGAKGKGCLSNSRDKSWYKCIDPEPTMFPGKLEPMKKSDTRSPRRASGKRVSDVNESVSSLPTAGKSQFKGLGE